MSIITWQLSWSTIFEDKRLFIDSYEIKGVSESRSSVFTLMNRDNLLPLASLGVNLQVSGYIKKFETPQNLTFIHPHEQSIRNRRNFLLLFAVPTNFFNQIQMFSVELLASSKAGINPCFLYIKIRYFPDAFFSFRYEWSK